MIRSRQVLQLLVVLRILNLIALWMRGMMGGVVIVLLGECRCIGQGDAVDMLRNYSEVSICTCFTINRYTNHDGWVLQMPAGTWPATSVHFALCLRREH